MVFKGGMPLLNSVFYCGRIDAGRLTRCFQGVSARVLTGHNIIG